MCECCGERPPASLAPGGLLSRKIVVRPIGQYEQSPEHVSMSADAAGVGPAKPTCRWLIDQLPNGGLWIKHLIFEYLTQRAAEPGIDRHLKPLLRPLQYGGRKV